MLSAFSVGILAPRSRSQSADKFISAAPVKPTTHIFALPLPQYFTLSFLESPSHAHTPLSHPRLPSPPTHSTSLDRWSCRPCDYRSTWSNHQGICPIGEQRLWVHGVFPDLAWSTPASSPWPDWALDLWIGDGDNEGVPTVGNHQSIPAFRSHVHSAHVC